MGLLSTVTEIIATICENVIILWFLTSFFGAKYTGIKKYSAFVATVVITTVFTSFLSNILPDKFLLCTAGFIILLILYCRLFLHGTLLCHILFPVIAETTLMLVAISIYTLSGNFMSQSPAEAVGGSSGSQHIVILIISKIVLFGLLGSILLLTRKNKTELHRNEWIAFSAVFAATLLSGICIYEIELGIKLGNANKILFFIPAVAGLIIINIISFYMLVRISREHKENIRKSMLLVQINEQANNLDEMRRIYNELRKIRHDIKGQLGTVSELIRSGKSEQALSFLENAGISQADINIPVHTDNEMLNAILVFLNSKCSASGITLRTNVMSSDISRFSAADISVILTNLTTNAIEASVRSLGEEILLELSVQRNYYCIRVANQIEKSVLESNPMLITTKKDKTAHGFGVASVKMLAEKYDGMTSFYEKNGQFIADVWLKLSDL